MSKVIEDIDKFIRNNNIAKIFIDVDGVIMASCQAIIDILNKKYGGNFEGSDVTNWNFQCCYPNMTSEEIEDIFNTSKFFEVVKPIDGALEFLNKYKDNIILVTKSSPENYIKKRKWLNDKGFENIPIIALPLNISKGYVNMQNCASVEEYSEEYSLFIDDSTNNLREVNADFCVMFKEYRDDKKREWQDGWKGMIMYHWQKGV